MKYLDETGLAHLWSKIKTFLNNKQDKLVSGTNIKTINNQSLLGSGNINISGGSGGGSTDWNDITNKPSTFPPESHNHFDENGNLNVPGDIITNGHSSPIGTVLSNSTDTAATMSTAGSWVYKTGCSVTLGPGTWVIKVQGAFRGYTTATGTTNATAGNRIVGIAYKDGTGSTTYNGCRADTYVPAGRAAYVQSVVIRNFANENIVYPCVQTSTAVGFMSARIEAVRIA